MVSKIENFNHFRDHNPEMVFYSINLAQIAFNTTKLAQADT